MSTIFKCSDFCLVCTVFINDLTTSLNRLSNAKWNGNVLIQYLEKYK